MQEAFACILPDDRSDGEAYIALPEHWASEKPWVIASHGSGRSARSYRDVPFYCLQRDLALKAGCAFAAVSNGTQAWGTDAGLKRLMQLVQRMDGYGAAQRFAVWGSSAGGALALRLALEMPQRAALILGMFPVIDLTRFSENEGLQRGWKDKPMERLRQANPSASLDRLPRVPCVIAHGLEDSVVPPAQHILRFAPLIPGPVSLHLPHAGHSTEALCLYDTPLFERALEKYVHSLTRKEG